MRHAYGDRAVDQALATLQEQRDQVAAAPKKQRRGPQLFRTDKITRLA
jgi:predicted amidohydrolase YtcJ